MKQFMSLVAVLAFISTPAFAQKKKTTVKTAPATSAPAHSTPAPTYSYSGGSSSYSSGPNFSAAATLGSIDGTFFFGPSLFLEWPTTLDGKNFTFGAQSGIHFGSTSGVSLWNLPIMATGKYLFEASGMIKPYVALAMGISIFHGSVAGISDTSAKFGLLVRPGMSFGQEGKLFAELPLGTMGGGFAILPSFGYHF